MGSTIWTFQSVKKYIYTCIHLNATFFELHIYEDCAFYVITKKISIYKIFNERVSQFPSCNTHKKLFNGAFPAERSGDQGASPKRTAFWEDQRNLGEMDDGRKDAEGQRSQLELQVHPKHSQLLQQVPWNAEEARPHQPSTILMILMVTAFKFNFMLRSCLSNQRAFQLFKFPIFKFSPGAGNIMTKSVNTSWSLKTKLSRSSLRRIRRWRQRRKRWLACKLFLYMYIYIYIENFHIYI